MADINSVKDASGYTIDDYKRMYNEAKAAGDASAMQAANNAANAIRTSQNVAAEYANVDIANTANKSSSSGGSGYTTINQNLHDGSDTDKSQFRNTLLDTINYANQNPSVTQGFTLDEFNALYGNVQSPTAQGYTIGQMYDIGAAGQYTYDEVEAKYAAAQGYTVAPTTYNGKPAYIITPNENTSRNQQSGTSGADESLLNSQQYAAVQYEKQQWSNYDTLYKQALATGNAALAEQYLAARDQAHTNAERIRASAWLGSYSGGADGSTFLTYGELANPEIYNMTGATPYEGNNPYANALGNSGNAGAAGTLGGVSGSVGIGAGSSLIGGSSGGSVSGGAIAATPSASNPALPELPDVKGNVNDYTQYIEDMYKAREEAALADLENAYQQNVAAIDRAGEGLDAAYQGARNQAAGADALSARNFAEIAAANGLNSGTTGQAALARSVTLQNNMNDINTQEAQSIADLELQRATAAIEYNNAIAKAKAENNLQLAEALYQEKVRYETALNAAIQQEWQNAMTKWQAEYQMNRDAASDAQWQAEYNFMVRQYEEEMALQQASMYGGVSSGGSYSGGTSYNSGAADSYGYTIDDYKAIYAQARESGDAELMQWANDGANAIRSALGVAGEYATKDIANVANRSSGVSSNTSNVKSPGSYSSGVSYNNGGLTSSQVKELQAVYGLDQDGYWGPNSQAVSGVGSASAAYASQNGSGMNDAYFRQAMTTIATQLDQGKTAQAESGVSSIWDRLTVSQKAQAQNTLKGFGIQYTP